MLSSNLYKIHKYQPNVRVLTLQSSQKIRNHHYLKCEQTDTLKIEKFY